MPPKHKDKNFADRLEESKSNYDVSRTQSDYEAFLQAFEKPTQIYRYLQARNVIHPIFMHRTLSYMKGRCKRNNKSRRSFTVDSILDRVKSRCREQVSRSISQEYLNLSLTGFFTEDSHESIGSIDVGVYLVKKSSKKRKCGSDGCCEVRLGEVSLSTVPHSPSKQDSTISISSLQFGLNNGLTSCNLGLLLRVTRHCRVTEAVTRHCRVTEVVTPTKKPPPSPGQLTVLCNGTDESAPKKRRSSRLSPNSITPPPTSPVKCTPLHKPPPLTKHYTAELTVYSSERGHQLTEGKYELLLQEVTDEERLMGQGAKEEVASWQTFSCDSAEGPFKSFRENSHLNFRVWWSKSAVKGAVESPEPNDEFIQNNRIYCPTETTDLTQAAEARAEARRKELAQLSPSKRRLYYQFIYQNNARQQTEARDDMRCPWCCMWCHQLYSLLKHLRLCHPRLHFTHSVGARGVCIDVSINEHYDGSYAGNPQDIHSYLGYAYCRQGPTRRTPVTCVLVFRPKKPTFSLNEFSETENEGSSTRQLVQGHNRLYFRTVTCQPVKPHEIDQICEDEVDPQWLRQKTINMIDEFTDVNEGEKEVMKMWNIHTMHHSYIGDCQLPVACLTFVDEYGPRIISERLTRNFVLHMINLCDFGLIRSDVIQQTMARFVQLQNHMTEISGDVTLSAAETATAALKLLPNIENPHRVTWVGKTAGPSTVSTDLSQVDTTDDDSQMSLPESHSVTAS